MEAYTLFTDAPIERILSIKGSTHFNRGDFTFFSQHGKAAYAYWSRLVCLTEEETLACGDAHDEAVAMLFKKQKVFKDNRITNEYIIEISNRFDCICRIELFFPEGLSGVLFSVNHEDMQWMAEMKLPFQFRMISEPMLAELKNHCVDN
ncbi:hypothetical protein JSQ81_08055 [Sporosarcina sp. Marseille-Q4063]|uniref:hypothetical protein n=1 Tax=Sporosarcina sp. Marseille-Q4063 TaxID=2810514 RepID=UPI001BB0C2B5|nr:hypothetical protein [Sporosarcina sp. Marseille-Q4063]QUW23462.1 hypothetical protein JSQ81_08055 [Sporosarcina sp. Marseille-Q4063]